MLDICYPFPFIFSAIRRGEIKFHFYNTNNSITNKQKIKNKYFTVLYVRSVSESFVPVASTINLKAAFSISKTLNKLIKVVKERLDPLSNQDVIYKISCLDCNTSYVGQTKRCLHTRVHEHSSEINKKMGSFSVISDHVIKFNHNFDWKEVKILDTELFYNKWSI